MHEPRPAGGRPPGGRMARLRLPHGWPPQPPDEPPLAVGVDVVDVDRFARVLAQRGSALTERVFTADERAACAGDVRRLAARLAAKESAAKALGLGIGPVAWHDVEVRAGPRGRPELALAGAALEAACAQGLGRWAVSLSHDTTHATAVVVATAGRTGR